MNGWELGYFGEDRAKARSHAGWYAIEHRFGEASGIRFATEFPTGFVDCRQDAGATGFAVLIGEQNAQVAEIVSGGAGDDGVA